MNFIAFIIFISMLSKPADAFLHVDIICKISLSLVGLRNITFVIFLGIHEQGSMDVFME